MAPKIVLHHLQASRSERLFWALEELGVDYEVKAYARTATRAAPPELKKVHPLGKAPAVTVDSKVLTESGFIIHYLLTHFPSGNVEATPSDDSTFWSHTSEGSLMLQLQAGVMVQLTAGAMAAGKIPGVNLGDEGKGALGGYAKFFNDHLTQPNAQAIFDQVETHLSKNDFFSGSDKPGEGDFMMFFPINSVLSGTRKDAGYTLGEGTKRWYARVMAREACKKGLERLRKEEQEQLQSQQSKI